MLNVSHISVPQVSEGSQNLNHADQELEELNA